ncbi:MAG: hypothetical protein LBE60_18560 [Microbacterium sp.]|jgi:hypothetical protein|uniref:hypothetical protein n=1 Tax=Microbacterium sp. TaxID=51671 RepID=UPI002829B7E8|nr:hypothetical protein [Microbacterium sp.]MDR2323636.1 hypothetical protein [Microbacterium sp.]
MWISGVLPPDAPDPRIERAEMVRALPFAIYGLVSQPSLEDLDSIGLAFVGGFERSTQTAVSVTYTLWRNPDDHDDPANLAELDEITRESLDRDPPWPRPRWLIEQAELMRYPMLWEAVRTTWTADAQEYQSLPNQLVQHVNYILMNRFRAELGIPDGPPSGPPGDEPWHTRLSAVNPRARLEVDGHQVDAVEIDTDPFVYGIGAQLSPEIVVTVVIPRADLPLIRLALATREQGGIAGSA